VGYQVVYGAVIILFIVGMPEGLVGFVRHMARRRQRSSASTSPGFVS
jgi:branched-chain amino acid transport system permease protein